MSNEVTNDCGGNWGPGGIPFSNTWARYNPPCPDYNKYTTDQLNMRRKAEILQYKQNSSRLTKKQKYAGLAKFNRRILLGSPQQNSANCTASTRASNVPGYRNLFLNRSVPVTGLVVTRNYGDSGGAQYPLKPLAIIQTNSGATNWILN